MAERSFRTRLVDIREETAGILDLTESASAYTFAPAGR
jgi:hypothetical protein